MTYYTDFTSDSYKCCR